MLLDDYWFRRSCAINSSTLERYVIRVRCQVLHLRWCHRSQRHNSKLKLLFSGWCNVQHTVQLCRTAHSAQAGMYGVHVQSDFRPRRSPDSGFWNFLLLRSYFCQSVASSLQRELRRWSSSPTAKYLRYFHLNSITSASKYHALLHSVR